MFVWILKWILWADSKWSVLRLTVSQWHYHPWCCTEMKGWVFIFSERMRVLCVTHVLTEHCSLKVFLRVFCLFVCLFSFFLYFIFSDQLWRTFLVRHILSYRLFLYKAASLYACSSPNYYVTTKLFVMVHVCQHFCRALSLITSNSICRITNKCVYNSCVCVTALKVNCCL